MVVFYPKVRDKYWLYGRKNRTFVLYLSITILLIGVALLVIIIGQQWIITEQNIKRM